MFYCDVGVIQCLFLLFVCTVALAMVECLHEYHE